MMIKKWKIVAAVATVLIAVIAIFVVLNLPKPLATSDSVYNLSRIDDGTYVSYAEMLCLAPAKLIFPAAEESWLH